MSYTKNSQPATTTYLEYTNTGATGSTGAGVSEKNLDGGRVPFFSNPLKKAWWRSWWWVFTIITLLVTLILLLVLFLAIIPAVTRHIVKGAHFEIRSMRISNPTEMGLTFSGTQSIGSVPFNPRTSGFTAQLYDQSDVHLFDLEVPTFSGSLATIPEQNVSILNSAAFSAFAVQLVKQAETNIYLLGATSVHIASRNVAVSFNKTLTLHGLSDLALDAKNASSVSNTTTYSLVHLDAIYRNSLVEFDVGASMFSLQYSNVSIGSLVSNLTLLPGSTPLTAHATANISEISGVPTTLADLRSQLQAGRDVTVTVQGTDNASGASWAREAIRAITVQTVLTPAIIVTTLVATYGSGITAALGL